MTGTDVFFAIAIVLVAYLALLYLRPWWVGFRWCRSHGWVMSRRRCPLCKAPTSGRESVS